MKGLEQKALEFATKKHEGQYFIDGTNRPYIEHCEGVYIHLLTYLPDNIEKRDIIGATALLHDTLEDTDTTYEELLENFGKEVADNVKALTKDEKLPYQDRLQDSINRILATSKEAQMVKLADRYFNLLDIPNTWGYEKCKNYVEEGRLIRDSLGESNLTLRNLLNNNIKKYSKKLERKYKEGEFMEYFMYEEKLHAYDNDTTFTLVFNRGKWEISQLSYAELLHENARMQPLTASEAKLMAKVSPTAVIESIKKTLNYEEERNPLE